jgi:hypothetical protein
MTLPASLYNNNFSDANGWNSGSKYLTIDYPDLNNDGRADVCGRGINGIVCARSSGGSFGAASVWESSFSDANGWTTAKYYSTIDYPDINNDGRADVCGRGGGGIWCATSNGTSFTGIALREASFSDANGWGVSKYYSTIRFPDLNADGRADVCGRGSGGIWCATSNGTNFTGISLWASAFSDANGWDLSKYHSTIHFPDVNNDGRADVCGRGAGGIWCGLSDGRTFGTPTLWSSTFSDAGGWDDVDNYSTIQFADVNHDGRDDVCARGDNGIYCAKSSGTSFGSLTRWTTQFSDAFGGDAAHYYRTIQIRDINQDNNADLCGRGILGVYCATGTGSAFKNPRLVAPDFSDAAGWTGAAYYRTLSVVDVDNDGIAEVCGRGGAGIYCAD